jgi:hypothetical protein
MASTKDVLDHHLKCFGEGDLKGILSDYAPGAVLFTADGPLGGTEAIRPLFQAMIAEFGKPGAPLSDADWVSRVVSRIGEAAGVKVDTKTKRNRKTGEPVEVVKWASCHDCRRAFGFRWSRRIMPPELRELMRHADLSTTMGYYVGSNAQSTAASLWAAYGKAGGNNPPTGNTFGNNGPAGGSAIAPETTQPLTDEGVAEYTSLDSNQ